MARVITVDLDRLDDLAGAAMAGYSHHVATARGVTGVTVQHKFMEAANPMVVRYLIALVRQLEADRLDFPAPVLMELGSLQPISQPGPGAQKEYHTLMANEPAGPVYGTGRYRKKPVVIEARQLPATVIQGVQGELPTMTWLSPPRKAGSDE